MRKTAIFHCRRAAGGQFFSAQKIDEKQLSDVENAYNPIPSPDGKLIAYVRTGWGRAGGSGGSGRSKLRGGDSGFSRSERVAYLSKADTFVWVELQRSSRTLLLTQSGSIAEGSMMTGAMVVPSPDERFIAVAGNGMNLWIYDIAQET